MRILSVVLVGVVSIVAFTEIASADNHRVKVSKEYLAFVTSGGNVSGAYGHIIPIEQQVRHQARQASSSK